MDKTLLKRIKFFTRYILVAVLQIPLHLLYGFSGFFPRNSQLWLFGCWEGKRFRGNSKLLYSHVKKNYPAIQAVWIVKNATLYEKLKNEQNEVYLAYSLKGFLLTLRAKYLIVTHGIIDMNEFVSRGGTLINLSHSIYPIKNMRLPYSVFEKIRIYLRFPYMRFPYWYFLKPDYAITASDFTKKATKHHYNLRDDQVIATGIPKTDFLLSLAHHRSLSSQDSNFIEFCQADKKRILFLPTHRGDRDFSIFHFQFDPQRLAALLESINGRIAFNFHPGAVGEKFLPDFSKYDNIQLLNSKGDEINELLSQIDLLITDYSSLFADFLIYEKPIIFAKFDHENYIKERGLFVDYDHDLPGPKAEDWPTLCQLIQEIFLEKNDNYQSKREAFKKLVYPHPDGEACERIAQFIQTLPE